MFELTLSDVGRLVVSVEADDAITSHIHVEGMEGDFWEDVLPKLLVSKDPAAACIVSELLVWLESMGVDNRTGKSAECDKMSSSNSYMDAFVESLIKFKKAQGIRMVQAMAGHQPILIYKTINNTYCFSFPPETIVYTPDDVKEMARTGRYSFGKRYMDKLVEVLLG